MRFENERVTFSLLIFLTSFALNLIWESLHSRLYVAHSLPFDSFFGLMLYASFIDAVLILAMYLFVVLMFGEFYWFQEKGRAVYFGLISLFVAALIEMRALLTNRWQYGELMPTVLGIGLTPLFQLAVTGLLAITISCLILDKNL